MNGDILFFFSAHLDALPLYELLEMQIMEQIPDVTVRVTKTQITFANRRGFAFVSFLPVRRPQVRSCITVSFGLGYRLQSPRIDAATEPYPNRWTHHVQVSTVGEIDGELMVWLREAAAFSANKR